MGLDRLGQLCNGCHKQQQKILCGLRLLVSPAITFVEDANHTCWSHIVPVLKLENESNFTFSGYLTSGPQMTFDLDL